MLKRLHFKRLHPDAKLPTRGSEGAAGLDLYAVERLTLEPGARAAVRTGLAVAIPRGFYGRVAPRSGLAVRHGRAERGLWDTSTLPPGDYTLRILAADFAGNEAVENRDVLVTIVRD